MGLLISGPTFKNGLLLSAFTLKILLLKMFALMREYISTYFYTVKVKWRLILLRYYSDGDNFQLHILLRQEKTDY